VPPTHAFIEAQSLLAAQPWNVAFGPQNCSNGPAWHVPSFPAAQVPPGHCDAALQFAFWFAPPTHVLVGEQIVSLHWLKFVAVPGIPHALPGHCELNAAP